jgi:hypothetical protein
MATVSGKGIKVSFDGADISGYFTDFSWKSNRGERERIDLSSKASYGTGMKTFEAGMAGDLKVTWTLKVLYIAGGTTAIEALTDGDTGDLTLYPETTGRLLTLAACVINDISFDGTFNGKAGYTVSGYGFTYPAFTGP